MTWTIKISKAARQDIQEIKQWYREQSYQALKDFTVELTAAIEALKDDFIDYRTVYKNNRRLPFKKFPYFIFYRRRKKKQFSSMPFSINNGKAALSTTE